MLNEKLSDFGKEADTYRKKSADMKHLTELERKQEQGEQFNQDDLSFLYELNSPIDGFGYDKDPRIKELRATRNPEEDMLIIFNCTKAQIATKVEDIKPNTKAFVGPLTPNIFQQLPETLEHIYTKFPEGRIKKETITIGGKSAKELIQEMHEAGINISNYAKDILQNPEFTTEKASEQATLIRLTVADMGFSKTATTDQIYERAKEFGLELCPPDTGPNYRLQYQNQPEGEWLDVGMKQITDPVSRPLVFGLERLVVGLWLLGSWAKPGSEWLPDRRIVFRLRKLKT